MQKITDQKHPKSTYLYGLSIMFQRAGYYGLRGIIVLYLISDAMSEGGLEMSNGEALGIYGILTASISGTGILGALIGDFLIKSKKVMIFGLLLQVLGAFLLCIKTVPALYISLGLIALGTGLYSPNLTAYFGKMYLSKSKLLDAAYTIYYSFINTGAFIGVFVLGYIGEQYSWQMAFVLGGFFNLIAMLFLVFAKHKTSENKTIQQRNPLNIRVAIIAITVLTLGIYWLISELAFVARYDMQLSFLDILSLENSSIIISLLESFPIVIFSILFAIIWSWYYNHQFMKILIGFIFAGISFAILFLIPEVVTAAHFWVFCLSIFFLSLAEIHLAPILHSVIIKYGNPKYLATLIALTSLASTMLIGLLKLFPNEIYQNSSLALTSSLIIISLMIVLLLFGITYGKKYIKS